MSEAVCTFCGMSSLTCPHGCGNLGVFIARRGRRQRPYIGCRTCGYSEWKGGNTQTDVCCADSIPGIDPPVDYETIDSVAGSDPYAEADPQI